MNLRARLARLEARAAPPDSDRPKQPPSRRLLRVLELYAVAVERASQKATGEAREARLSLIARLQEAADLLRGYVQSHPLGVHTEYQCSCSLARVASWSQAKEGTPWHGQPFPLANLANNLRQCLEIDRWRTAGWEG
jgi:hypothetical protein